MIDALSRATHRAIQLQPSLRGIHLVHDIPAGADDVSLLAAIKAKPAVNRSSEDADWRTEHQAQPSTAENTSRAAIKPLSAAGKPA